MINTKKVHITVDKALLKDQIEALSNIVETGTVSEDSKVGDLLEGVLNMLEAITNLPDAVTWSFYMCKDNDDPQN